MVSVQEGHASPCGELGSSLALWAQLALASVEVDDEHEGWVLSSVRCGRHRGLDRGPCERRLWCGRRLQVRGAPLMVHCLGLGHEVV